MPDYPLSRQALHDRLRAGAKNTWSDWLDVRAEGGKATLRIHDVIGDYWAETTSGDIAAKIDAIEAEEITVSINSPGGNIFDGIAIYNALRSHKARIVTRVDGIAASIASVIAQAGDERQMMGGVLDHQNLVIAEVYARHSGQDAADLLDLMAEETWYTASGTVEAGLADVVIDASPTTSAAGAAAEDGETQARFDPSLSLALLDL